MNSFTPTKTLKLLSILSGALVMGLAAGAFVLSYDALKSVASENGISSSLVWIWPLILDGAIVVFSISALRASLYLESCRYAMCLVVAATVASIAFNALHAPSGIAPKVMAGLPPLALFLCFELLIRQLRSEVLRSQKIQTTSGGPSKQRKKAREQPKPKKAPEDQSEVSPKQTAIVLRRSRVSELLDRDSSAVEIAQKLGVSSKTVERDIAAIGRKNAA